MRNNIPSTRRKNICNTKTIHENVRNDKGARKEMSNGIPMINIEIIAATATSMIAAIGYFLFSGKNNPAPSAAISKARRIFKAFKERIGKVIEIDNKMTSVAPQSLSNEGAKNQIVAMPGQIAPDINRIAKIISCPDIFLISSNWLMIILFSYLALNARDKQPPEGACLDLDVLPARSVGRHRGSLSRAFPRTLWRLSSCVFLKFLLGREAYKNLVRRFCRWSSPHSLLRSVRGNNYYDNFPFSP